MLLAIELYLAIELCVLSLPSEDFFSLSDLMVLGFGNLYGLGSSCEFSLLFELKSRECTECIESQFSFRQRFAVLAVHSLHSRSLLPLETV